MVGMKDAQPLHNGWYDAKKVTPEEPGYYLLGMCYAIIRQGDCQKEPRQYYIVGRWTSEQGWLRIRDVALYESHIEFWKPIEVMPTVVFDGATVGKIHD